MWATQTAAGKGVLRAFRPAAKTVWTLVDQEGLNPVRVSASATDLYWVAVGGPDWSTGTYAKASLWYAALSADTTDVNPAFVADLPATTGLADLHVGGGFASTIGCGQDADVGAVTCSLLVVSLSAAKVWRIQNRPGKSFQRVLNVTSSEILLGEADHIADPSAAQRIDSLVRLSTVDLGKLAKGWPR